MKYATENERKAGRRAAKAAADRKRRARLSSKQLKAIADAQRKRRANMTPEQMEVLRAKNAECARKRRANMTPEHREILRVKDAEAARKRLANMTPDQREILRAKDAALKREKQLTLSCQPARAGEEREKMRAAYFGKKRRRFDAMSEEERKKQRVADAKKIRQRSAIRKIKEKLENNTTAQRIQRIMIKTGRITEKKPRYESAINFMKDSLLKIGNLHIEIGDIKKQLKQTISEAITNVIDYERMKKQTAAVGCRSLTYVQISPPLEPDVIQHQLSSIENETDPLLLPSAKWCQPGRLCPTADENAKTDINFDDLPSDSFEVCVHDSSAVFEETSEQQNNLKKFGCSVCSKKFGTSLGLTIHLKGHSANSNECNKCTVCQKEFDDYNLMTIHYLQVHSFEFSSVVNEVETEEMDEEMDRFLYEIDYLYSRKCLICFQSMDKLRFGLPTYSNHIISDHSDNKELLKHFTYSCSRCDKPHLMMRSLETHWTTFCYEKWKNEDGNNGRLMCEHCGMKFSSDKNLSTHLNRFHTEKKTVMCEQCGNQYKTENSLKGHIAWVHEDKGEYKYACEQCGKKFKTSGNLNTHTKNIHFGEKPYICKFCSRGFSQSSNLEYHLNTHTGEKPYKCKHCNKSFAAKTSLTVHEGVHEGYNCKMCGEGFPNYIDLCHHKKLNHHNRNVDRSGIKEKTLKNNKKCDICGNSFKSYHCAYVHKRIVHGNKNYVCDICGKIYKTAAALNDHKISHDNLERFGCSLCERKFRFKTYFYQHRKKAHVTENAHLVKLISDRNLPSSVTLSKSMNLSNPNSEVTINQPISEQLSNTMETLYETTEDVPQLIEERNDSNCNLGTDGAAYFSPELEDYSSDRECVNEDNRDDYDLPQLDIAEVKNVKTFLSVSENVQESSLSKKTILKAASNQQLISSSVFVDFSRANVPLDLLHDESETEGMKPKLEVFVEDSEDDSFITKLNNHDLVNLKTETVADVEEYDEQVSNQFFFSDSISDDENELQTNNQEIKPIIKCVNKGADLPQNTSSPRLIVKLTRLLEYYCVPCDKMRFAISHRQIHQHSRTHRADIPSKRNQFKSDKVGEKITRIGSFDCSYCERKNLSGIRISAHCAKEHPGKEPFKWKICSKMFSNYHSFYRHNKNGHDIKVETPSAESELNEGCHPKRKKNPSSTGNFDCVYCEKKSLPSKLMIDHCSEKHPGKKPFKCKICPKMYSKAQALRAHKYRHKQKEKSNEPDAKKEILCEECGKAFYTREAVRTHIRFVHKGLRPKQNVKFFPCDICSKLIRERELENHKMRHLGIKSHSCDECEKSFVTQRELNDHVNIVHKNMKRRYKYDPPQTTQPFSCNLCPYVCKKESGLTSHSQLHDPSRKYACDECGLRYKFYTNVITHKNYKHKKDGKTNIQFSSADA